jgi:phosphoribosylcarboxyaminoimidazole (NCAIR) mutase
MRRIGEALYRVKLSHFKYGSHSLTYVSPVLQFAKVVPPCSLCLEELRSLWSCENLPNTGPVACVDIESSLVLKYSGRS